MARSDLLVSLVKAGTTGDQRGFRTAAEAIIAEERAKRHDVRAEKLVQAIQQNGSSGGNGAQQHALSFAQTSDMAHRGRDFLAEVKPRRSLEDVVLPSPARAVVTDFVEEQRRANILRAHGMEPRSRVLLVGPPGTGKTTLAEALADAVAVSLFVVRYESMIGSYLGETAARLKRVFDYARTTPCVLFFDEFDAIGKERGDTHETGEIKRVVTSLLMQIDELPSYTIVVAATNHPELLDRAAWRRFQVRLNLPLPGQKELAKYIEVFLARFGEPHEFSALSIARALGRVSYAEAEQFCLDVRRRQILSIGEKHLKAIISDQLGVWTSSSRAKRDKTADKECCDGGTPTASSSKS